MKITVKLDDRPLSPVLRNRTGCIDLSTPQTQYGEYLIHLDPVEAWRGLPGLPAESYYVHAKFLTLTPAEV